MAESKTTLADSLLSEVGNWIDRQCLHAGPGWSEPPLFVGRRNVYAEEVIAILLSYKDLLSNMDDRRDG